MHAGAALLAASALLPAAALSFTIEYGAERPDELKACDQALYRGQTVEARSCYAELELSNEDPRIRAEAARASGNARTANGYFQKAIEAYPDDPGVRARWGELFLETHQDNEAVKLFQESLSLDSDYAPAFLGLAKVSAGRFEGRAREWVDDVLDQRPDDLGARLLLVRMDLEVGDVDRADETLDDALEIAEDTGAAPIEIYALKASVDLLRGVEGGDWTSQALDYNPAYGDIYAIPAYFYVITRRYREAIELYRKAVEIQPDLYAAHAELGVNLLRENRIAEAQRELATAYRGDPYSAPVVNTLRLIDSFDNFVVSRHGAAAEPDGAPPGTILRLHKDEADVIEPYVLKLANDAIAAYTKRYAFELKEPVVVELYPNPDDFAVRTSGLPGIGLLGVTFGYLVAMDSPSGRPDGDFHWGTTLWHEMAHVFTLEATGHLVPRWFSEGVSVYEEWSTGPLPGRHIPVSVLQAIADDRLLPIDELDSGFIRPTYENQVIVSYMQAGLICEYIAANWGQQGLRDMLARYADGDETGPAVEAALGITPGEFDDRFAAYVDDELGDVVANLDDWRDAVRQANERGIAGDWSAALDSAEQAIELYPDYVDEGSPYLVKARALSENGEPALALDALGKYHALGGYDPTALFDLGTRLHETGDEAGAIAVLEDLLMVAPLNEDLHAELGDWLLEAGKAEQALAEYEALFAMQPHDQAAAQLRLAKAHYALGNSTLGREHLLYALEIAPNYREAQQLLLETMNSSETRD